MSVIDWKRLQSDCVNFAQRLIQTPSMPGNEQAISRLVTEEMRNNDFDDVWQDEIGNVFGRVHGRNRQQGALILNSHLDHVDPGDVDLWPVPPYSGKIVNDHILGRGACDIKGPLAIQIYSMVALIRAGKKPRRDVIFCGVVEEEVGGAGAVYWMDHLDYPVSLIVLGEPSGNNLSLGHRGILQMWVAFQGKSVHSSVPKEGKNPNYALAEFLVAMKQESSKLIEHPLLGPTTVAPTIIEVDTQSVNVTPAWTQVLLDFRTASESSNSLQAFVQKLVGEWPVQISNAFAKEPDTSFEDSDELIYGYYTAPDDEAVGIVRAAVYEGTGTLPELRCYQFATDGRHFVPLGIPIIGYSAGEDHYAHTVDERISISMMAESLHGHLSILETY
jgi:putative selenium metabolism hydrolase